MQNLQGIRRRIRSVQNTQKITRAMQMVAGAKLRRSQGELFAFQPYARKMGQIVGRFLQAHPSLEHPFLEDVSSFSPSIGVEGRLQRESTRRSSSKSLIEDLDPRFRGDDNKRREPARIGLLVVSSDTGLCGTYNERILSVARNFLQENPSASVVTIGKKGNRSLNRRGIPRIKEVLDWGGRYESSRARALAQWMLQLYVGGTVSAWWIAYTQFISAMRFTPTLELFLPFERAASKGGQEKVILEPDVKTVADQLFARFIQANFKRMILSAFTAEHSARMIAMKNATDNAGEMIEHLTLVRNKIRQAAITKELIEVVSGASALQ